MTEVGNALQALSRREFGRGEGLEAFSLCGAHSYSFIYLARSRCPLGNASPKAVERQ